MNILAYDDNPDFGGHQLMACQGLEALAAEPSVKLACMVNPANRRLVARLRDAQIPVIPPQTRLTEPRPDLLLCIQGDRAQSIRGITAARHKGIACTSYLALPHSLADMGAKLGALRDRFRRRSLPLPDRYITISNGMRDRLLALGVSQPVAVVPNGIESPSQRPERIRKKPFVFGMLGRVEFSQKRHDFVIDCFNRYPDAFAECRLLIAGDGPDAARLERHIAASPRRADIERMPWQPDPETFYDQIDLLLLPSRYEGMPLIMLEALVRGIPVAGSNRDGMAEWLPSDWRFEPDDGPGFCRAAASARNGWEQAIGPLRQAVAARHSIESFRRSFVAAVLG